MQTEELKAIQMPCYAWTDTLNLREAEGHMFRTREALFEDAYRLQEKRIAYNADREESSPTRSEAR